MQNARVIGTVVATLALTLGHAALADDAKPADSSDVIQKVGHGEINWSAKKVTATGSGAANLKDGPVAVARLNAERAAKMDALRNILESLKGVQIDGKRNAGDLMSNGSISTRVQGVAKGFRVVDTKYYSDGSVDVIVELPIDENLIAALNIEGKGKKKKGGAVTFTGLVVNAKGLGVAPSLAPRIVDEKGKEVFGTATVTPDGVKDGGIANYTGAPEDAKKAELVGANPLVVKGLSLDKGSKTDIVISNADAEKLRDSAVDTSFLSEGKVVIVVD
jgi:hypothetical protein